jgi:hypothetical protein
MVVATHGNPRARSVQRGELHRDPVLCADTGVLLSWKTDEFNYCATLTDLGCASQFQKPAEYHLTTTNGAAIAQDATMLEIAPNQTGPITLFGFES